MEDFKRLILSGLIIIDSGLTQAELCFKAMNSLAHSVGHSLFPEGMSMLEQLALRGRAKYLEIFIKAAEDSKAIDFFRKPTALSKALQRKDRAAALLLLEAAFQRAADFSLILGHPVSFSARIFSCIRL